MARRVRLGEAALVGEHVLQRGDHQRERGPELVADVGEEPALELVELGELAGLLLRGLLRLRQRLHGLGQAVRPLVDERYEGGLLPAHRPHPQAIPPRRRRRPPGAPGAP